MSSRRDLLPALAVLSAAALGACLVPAPRASAASARRPYAVDYAGLRIPVPAGWAVVDLDRDPSACVRRDVHAIYLGTPGDDQLCPARLIGTTETLSVRPPGTPDAPRGDVPLPVPRTAAVVTGTYGADPAALSALAHSITPAPAGRTPASPAGTPAPPGRTPGLSGGALSPGRTPAPPGRTPAPPGRTPGLSGGALSPGRTPGSSAGTPAPPGPSGGALSLPGLADGSSGGGTVHGSVAMRVAERPVERVWTTGRGFDTCSAPSRKAMAAWRSAYSVTSVYIGGAARSCAQPNLSAGWIRAVRAMGYRLIPAYVGLQAPCGGFQNRIEPRRSRAQGAAAADDAVARARSLGIPRSRPIYDDMEAYDSKNAGCRNAVLAFLDAWSGRLRARGYVPGVYGSAKSVVADLGRARGIRKPHAVWFARWDGKADLAAAPYLDAGWWTPHRRIKQFRGDHTETHGGITLNVDSNVADGRVY